MSKRPIGGDLILPVLAVGYAAYYLFSVRGFPFEAQMTGIGLALILVPLCFLQIGLIVMRVLRGSATLAITRDILGARILMVRRVGLLVLTVGVAAAFPILGFTLSVFLLILLGTAWLGVRPLRNALVFATAAALGGWLFFIVVLDTRFPHGPFEWLIGQVF